MDDVVQQARAWMTDGRDVVLLRTVSVTGLSARRPGDLAAATAGQPLAGVALGGLVGPEQVTSGPGGPRLLEVVSGDEEAGRLGMSCGGTGRVLVQPATDVPEGAWRLLAAGEPVCLVTNLDGGGLDVPRVGRTTWFGLDPTTLREDDAPRHGEDVVRLFRRGASATAVVEQAGRRLLVSALWPTPTLVVVGEGLLAQALGRLAETLDRRPVLLGPGPGAVDAVRGLRRPDAVVVLTHDLDGSGSALAAALASGAGYVGALGSRRTTAARAEWLVAHGVSPEDVARVHGPAGLDVGARTPAEIAVSIVAEVLSVRSGAPAVPLASRGGPVLRDGPAGETA